MAICSRCIFIFPRSPPTHQVQSRIVRKWGRAYQPNAIQMADSVEQTSLPFLNRGSRRQPKLFGINRQLGPLIG